jgi:hypothetical protein
MKTVKLSYSILRAWATGQQEEAVSMYLGKSLPKTPAMELGWIKHKEWELYVKKHSKLPRELGGGKLNNPLVEQKHQRYLDFSDKYRILLRGVIDLEDENVGIDYKVGKTPVTNYTNSLQAEVYKVLRPNLKQFIYIAFNPYIKQEERGLVYLSEYEGDTTALERGLNFVYTFGGEMISYLETQNLIRDFKE